MSASRFLAMLCIAVAVVRPSVADMTVEANSTETISGEASPGTVTLKEGATVTTDNATVTDPLFVFDYKFTSTKIGPGSTLTGGGFKYSVNSGFGANAHSNTVVVCGPNTTWTNPSLLLRNYSQPNASRGDKWTTVVVTNGASISGAAFASSAIDEKDSRWYFEDSSFGFSSSLSLLYAARTTFEVAQGASFSATDESKAVDLIGADNALLVHGSGASLNVAGTLFVGGKGTRFFVEDGAQAEIGNVGGSTGSSNCVVRVSGEGSRLDVGGNIDMQGSYTNSLFVVEDGAELTAKKFGFASTATSCNSAIVVRNGASVSVQNLYPGGRTQNNGTYGGGGTRMGLVVSNATVAVSNACQFAAGGMSNYLHVVDGARIDVGTLKVIGVGMEVVISNAAVTASGLVGGASMGTEEMPARIVFCGTNATLVAGTFSEGLNGTPVNCKLIFDIPAEGFVADAPCFACTNKYTSSYVFASSGVELDLNIDRRWACSGTENFIDLIEISANSGNMGCFTSLAGNVDADTLKGCRLEYVANRKGNAGRMLRLYAGAKKGLVVLVR